MNISATELNFDATMMWVSLADGRKLGVPLAYFPRLLAATPEQRLHFELSGGGTGMHWDELDEDISVQGLKWPFSKNISDAGQNTTALRVRFAKKINHKSARGNQHRVRKTIQVKPIPNYCGSGARIEFWHRASGQSVLKASLSIGHYR